VQPLLSPLELTLYKKRSHGGEAYPETHDANIEMLERRKTAWWDGSVLVICLLNLFHYRAGSEESHVGCSGVTLLKESCIVSCHSAVNNSAENQGCDNHIDMDRGSDHYDIDGPNHLPLIGLDIDALALLFDLQKF